MADLLVYLRQLRGKKDGKGRDSLYSSVSYSEATPRCYEVWLELPDEIKHDPIFTPLKESYEQKHGKLDSSRIIHETQRLVLKKDTDGSEDDELNIEDDHNGESSDGAMELTETVDKSKLQSSKTKTSVYATLRILKLMVLVAGWTLLTVSLLLNTEREEVQLHTVITGGKVKEHALNANGQLVKIHLTLTGPFLRAGNSTNMINIWLQRDFEFNGTEQLTQIYNIWRINLQPDTVTDFSPSVSASKTLQLEAGMSEKNTNISETLYLLLKEKQLILRLNTTGNNTVPLTVSYQLDTLSESHGIMYSMLLLFTLYTLIIFEIVNRTVAALLTSSLSVAILALTGSRPSLPELVSWLDTETLVLLFSMMMLVAILTETGLFDCLAVVAFQVTGGRIWPLINCLCFFTALFSTFLDNVTTVLLMTPVTIRLCEVMSLNPIPVLISMVIFSNVGGAATPVGDPPNVIIASQPFVLRENINFTTFTFHMGLGILFVCLQTYLQLRFMFRDVKRLKRLPTELQGLQHKIDMWSRTASSIPSCTRDEILVKRALERKVKKLKVAFKESQIGQSMTKSDPKFRSTLADMKEKYYIRDKQLLVKSSICICFVIVVFFLHCIPELQRLSLGWTALLGVLLLLILSEKVDLEPILARVEWSTLLFFAGLFVLMEALSKLGLISWIGKITESVIMKVGEESRLAVAILLVLWVSGLVSAFVDNIPLTTMMVRVIATLADSAGLGLPLAPLAWALSFGACLGGNGTLIGASANVVCAGVAEQHGYRFTFLEYLKIGFPIMIGNLIVASVYLLISHCLFQWH